jgi:hypothetical protein
MGNPVYGMNKLLVCQVLYSSPGRLVDMVGMAVTVPRRHNQVVYPLLPTVMPETSSLLLHCNHNAGLCVVCTCCVFTELGTLRRDLRRPRSRAERLGSAFDFSTYFQSLTVQWVHLPLDHVRKTPSNVIPRSAAAAPANPLLVRSSLDHPLSPSPSPSSWPSFDLWMTTITIFLYNFLLFLYD